MTEATISQRHRRSMMKGQNTRIARGTVNMRPLSTAWRPVYPINCPPFACFSDLPHCAVLQRRQKLALSSPFTLAFRSNSCKLSKSQTKTTTATKKKAKRNQWAATTTKAAKANSASAWKKRRNERKKRTRKCGKQIKDQHA